MEDMLIEEFEAIQIELNRAPGMRTEKIREIIRQLLLREIIDLKVKVQTNATHATRIGLYRLGLKTFKPKVLL